MKTILAVLISCLPAFAMETAHGFCEQGGKVVVTSGVSSSTKVQQSYPGCTVYVFLTGTSTLATIFTATGSTKPNPFTADSFGAWNFSAANGVYDVRINGGGPPALGVPYTFAAITLFDPTAIVTGLLQYNAGGTLYSTAHVVSGSITLGAGIAIVNLTGLAVFTSNSSYTCTMTDETAVAALKYTRVSGTQFNITGTGTDAVSYICVGN